MWILEIVVGCGWGLSDYSHCMLEKVDWFFSLPNYILASAHNCLYLGIGLFWAWCLTGHGLFHFFRLCVDLIICSLLLIIFFHLWCQPYIIGCFNLPTIWKLITWFHNSLTSQGGACICSYNSYVLCEVQSSGFHVLFVSKIWSIAQLCMLYSVV